MMVFLPSQQSPCQHRGAQTGLNQVVPSTTAMMIRQTAVCFNLASGSLKLFLDCRIPGLHERFINRDPGTIEFRVGSETGIPIQQARSPSRAGGPH